MMIMKYEEAWSCSAQLGATKKLKLKLKRNLQTGQDAPQDTKKIELIRSSPKVYVGTSSPVGDQIQRQADAQASETLIKNFDQLPPLLLIHSMFNDSGDEEWLFEKKQNQQTEQSSSSKRFKANQDEPMAGCAIRTLWPPKAQWLPQAGIYASPFTVPL